MAHAARSGEQQHDQAGGRRRGGLLLALNVGAVLLFALFAGLAAWQMHRREWKLQLIARIEARAFAAPAAPPDDWDNVTAARDEYRRVVATGTWIDQPPALVRAVTELGGGFWVMSPFALGNGTVVFVNRGFVPEQQKAATARPPQSQSIVGLLRLSEPGGGFLQKNDPVGDRWFSRDTAAIAKARTLPSAAPYFIDADRTAWSGEPPVPGLTVLSFSNNHLLYAITWAILAAMVVGAAFLLNRDANRLRP